MAERSRLEIEVQDILRHIDNGDNFLLSGGAGSGKTYSLVQVIKQVIEENPNSKVACMTYTNAAVKEIEERVNHKNLIVSTIHDFLWDNIKSFQKELKKSLVELINDEESKIKNPEDITIPENYFDNLEKIQYKEYLKIQEGKISHDEVLILANYIFQKNPKICSILKDKFKFIFIDEYQDTNKAVIEIFLNHLKQSSKKNIIGFFGDAMQSIYDDGIGNLDEYKGSEDDKVREVKKAQNRRNPQLVINLANKIRNDGIQQTPSLDVNAPNMDSGIIKQGSVKFYHSNSNNIEAIKTQLGWNFSDSKKTKILNLTHNLIAPNAWFENLMAIYSGDKILDFKNRLKDYIKDNSINDDFSTKTFGEVISQLQNSKTGSELNKVMPTAGMQLFIDQNLTLYTIAKSINWDIFSKVYLDKDQLVDDKKQDQEDENKKGSKRDDLIKHLFKIQNNISLYNAGKFNEFIRKTEYNISSTNDKKTLKERIDELSNVWDKTIEEVIKKADAHGICKKDDRLQRFITEKEYIFNRVKEMKFSEFQNLYNYLEGSTPFSTQHKTKGAEFDNVLIILDNGWWNNYNFEKMFAGGNAESVENRTKKIFYVCCTRAKESLAIFFYNPSQAVISKANELFWYTNCINI